MSVSIKYDGSVIGTIEGGQTITLHTSGMKAKTDIVIQNNHDELSGTWYIHSLDVGSITSDTIFYFDGSAKQSSFYTIIDGNCTKGNVSLNHFRFNPPDSTTTFHIYSSANCPRSMNAFGDKSGVDYATYYDEHGEVVGQSPWSQGSADNELMRTISIGMTSQEFIARNGADKYNMFMTWLRAHASRKANLMKAEVYYKTLIDTLSAGKTMTLHCGGAKLTDDIVVKAVEDDTNISYTLDGYWYIFVNPNKPLANFSEHIAFISDSTNYSKISYDDEGIKYDETIAFSNHPDYLVSKKYEYRLVRFSSPQTVSKEFYEWFTANATNKTITFTIDCAVYQAFENHTWTRWIDTDFNTIGAIETYGGNNTNYIKIGSSGGSYIFVVADDANNYVLATDDIVANKAYVAKEYDPPDTPTHSGGAN